MSNRLSFIEKGKRVKVLKLHTAGKLMQKLLDMGFVQNATVEVIREAPLFDPIELKIQNYNISLRKSEANLIEVKSI